MSYSVEELLHPWGRSGSGITFATEISLNEDINGLDEILPQYCSSNFSRGGNDWTFCKIKGKKMMTSGQAMYFEPRKHAYGSAYYHNGVSRQMLGDACVQGSGTSPRHGETPHGVGNSCTNK